MFFLFFSFFFFNGHNFVSPAAQDEREARETVKREQDEAYRLSLEADRKKVNPGNRRSSPSTSDLINRVLSPNTRGNL